MECNIQKLEPDLKPWLEHDLLPKLEPNLKLEPTVNLKLEPKQESLQGGTCFYAHGYLFYYIKLGTPASRIPRRFARIAYCCDLGGLKNHNFLP